MVQQVFGYFINPCFKLCVRNSRSGNACYANSGSKGVTATEFNLIHAMLPSARR